MRDGKPYCLHCFDAMFAEYCDFCGEPIGVDQGQMSHDGQHWHATDQCFACSTCRCSLLGRPFLPRRGAIYCSIACSKGEPPTPSDSSGPGLRTPRQKPIVRQITKPSSDNESSTPPASPRKNLNVITNNKDLVQSPEIGERLQDSCIAKSDGLGGPSNTPILIECPLPTISGIKGLDRVVLERNLEKLLVEKSIGSDFHSLSMSPESVDASQNEQVVVENVQSFDMTDFTAKFSEISREQSTQYPPQLKLPSATDHLKLNLMSSTMTSSMPELTAKLCEPLQGLETCATTPDDVSTPDISELTRTDSQIILPKPTPIKKEVRFETPDNHQDSLPRSRTYSGRGNHRNVSGGNGRRNRRSGNGHHSRHRKYSVEHSRHQHEIKKHNLPSPSTSTRPHPDEESDITSICSTCSSSSSSGDEKAYELPARRTYLGTRVSYMPNDALAAARRRKQAHDTSDKDNKNCIIS